MKLLVKIGGAQLEQPAARAELARALGRARAAGHELVVVHGGGNQIRDLVRRLGLPEQYHQGLRVTDAQTAEVVLAVLSGSVNKALVAALGAQGLDAVGLCGADGGSFGAQALQLPGVELGYVGRVHTVDRRLVDTLLAGGFVPVIATTAALARGCDGPDAHFYNINADMAAGPLGAALRCDAILFLTDVPAVLDAHKQRLPLLSPAECARLRESGVIAGGMLPKVEAALEALASHPGALVKIAPAAGPDCVLRALDAAVGTLFQAEYATHG
ncbi:MAG: acetylglutamate kinase [Planctomycetes bacterium]|nr:acetylglutamate kinase [Planctomycetota bacterium]